MLSDDDHNIDKDKELNIGHCLSLIDTLNEGQKLNTYVPR